jgi:hypothetical protein
VTSTNRKHDVMFDFINADKQSSELMNFMISVLSELFSKFFASNSHFLDVIKQMNCSCSETLHFLHL